MEYFQILNFRPTETNQDATDQDRTALRICEGLLPVPQGALSNGPQWETLWGLSSFATNATTALAGADNTKAHILTITRGSRTFLVVWSLSLGKALGLFEVASSPNNADFAGTSSVTITATNNATWRGKDGSAPWYASRIGDRIILGNGIDTNLVWRAGALSLFGPSSPPADTQNHARVRFPPCTAFRLDDKRRLFAAGNASSPLRVWIANAPNSDTPFLDGVYSLETSFIDVHPHQGATKVVGLSCWGNYVTAHTDRAPVNLFGVDNTSDGWKCQQAASAANASALSPACLGDADGDAAFYLGHDLEVYADEAVRGGPWDKRVQRDQEIVTTQGVGVWNRDMLRGQPSALGYSVIYDRVMRLFWIFARTTYGPGMVWAFFERTRTFAGPIHYPDAHLTCAVSALGKTYAVAITGAGQLLWADLSIRETEPQDIEPVGTALGASYEPVTSAPTPAAGIPYVGISGDTLGWVEQPADIGLTDPLGAVQLDPTLSPLQFFNNATIARAEFPWQSLGAEATLKNLHEIAVTVDRDSRGYLMVCAENERGHRRYRWVGSIHGRTKPIRAAVNLLGARFRVRLVVVAFNYARLIIRDARLGYTVGGGD